jgi:hypothetical protein
MLFNINSAIFQLHHGENNLIFNEMRMRSALIVGSSPDRVKPKTIKLVFVASPLRTQHEGERKSKDWLAQNRDNVSKWDEMSIRRVLFQ